MKNFLTIMALAIAIGANAWGMTGHRVIGEIAEKHLTKKARKNLALILQNETLAECANYMDFIKSEHAYDHMSPWHYATIPDGQTYAEAGTPEEGDVIATLNRLIEELKSKKFTDEDELFALKCLVHLVGDIHQPLHVGNGTDRGGNDVKLEFFWEPSNLHRVWDSGIIDYEQYSYTEYVEWINHPSEAQKANWSNVDVLAWANESKEARNQCYETVSENKKINYRYVYDNIDLVNQRLLQAGLRLAAVLNEIYG